MMPSPSPSLMTSSLSSVYCFLIVLAFLTCKVVSSISIMLSLLLLLLSSSSPLLLSSLSSWLSCSWCAVVALLYCSSSSLLVFPPYILRSTIEKQQRGFLSLCMYTCTTLVCVGHCILQKWIWFPSTLFSYLWVHPGTSEWFVSFKFVGWISYSESPDCHRNPTKVARWLSSLICRISYPTNL